MRKLFAAALVALLTACQSSPDPLGEQHLLAFSTGSGASDEQVSEILDAYSESFKCWTRDVGPYPEYDIISEQVSESGKALTILLSHPDYPNETALKIKVVPKIPAIIAYGPMAEGDLATFIKQNHRKARFSTATCGG